jgi:hypothetical protein
VAEVRRPGGHCQDSTTQAEEGEVRRIPIVIVDVHLKEWVLVPFKSVKHGWKWHFLCFGLEKIDR